MIKSKQTKRIEKASPDGASVKKCVSFAPDNYNAVVDAANASGAPSFSAALGQMIRASAKRKP